MKEVHFGYDNSNRPSGSHEGLGLTGRASGPVTGELLGFICGRDGNYMAVKVNLAFGNKESDLGRVEVREALADIYPDASGILFVNQDKSRECQQLEDLLNSPKAQSLIERGISIQEICSGSMVPFSFECVSRGETVSATAIKPEVFEQKKQLIDRCHKSFSDMQAEKEGLDMETVVAGRSL